MTSVPVRAIMVDVPASEAYSLESVGKHGFCKRLTRELKCFFHCRYVFFFFVFLFNHGAYHSSAIEVGPQPNGVLRADIFNLVKEALDLTFEFIQKFNDGGEQLSFLFSDFLGFRVENNRAKSLQTDGEIQQI